MEWLLLVISLYGRINTEIHLMKLQRFDTEHACKVAGASYMAGASGRVSYVCFPVAPIPK